MKKELIIVLFSILLTGISYAQISDKEAIRNSLFAFTKAGDQNNVEELDKYLDQNYRVVMNRLFGSKEVSVISKLEYLEKIKSKEWGGDQRNLSIENLTINGTTANAKVTFKGSKMTFVSLIALVKNDKGQWKLIEDMPIVL